MTRSQINLNELKTMKKTNKILSCFTIVPLAVMLHLIMQSCISTPGKMILELSKDVNLVRIKNEAGAILSIENDDKGGTASREITLCKGESIRVWGAMVSQSDSEMEVSFSGESRVIKDSKPNYVLIIREGEPLFGKDVGWEIGSWE